MVLLLLASLSLTAGETPKPNEKLIYSVNWPSGLSLGEAHFTSSRDGDKWKFTFSLDAAVPGFSINDALESVATGDFCSLEFSKKLRHGARLTDEKTTFDPQKGSATRETTGGGTSDISAGACAKDALAFLYFLRRELKQGRLPAPQTIYFGAAYQLRLDYGGAQRVRVNDRYFDADRLSGAVKGPASQVTFEIYLARDEVRTPVLIRAPFSLGSFSMELMH